MVINPPLAKQSVDNGNQTVTTKHNSNSLEQSFFSSRSLSSKGLALVSIACLITAMTWLVSNIDSSGKQISADNSAGSQVGFEENPIHVDQVLNHLSDTGERQSILALFVAAAISGLTAMSLAEPAKK